MSLTHLPHGLLATPNLGGTGRLMDLFESDNMFFVDAITGSQGNTGKEPKKAKAKPSEALDACSGGASIYIRPAGIRNNQTTSVYQYYTDDVVLPYTKSGIALIGAGEPQMNGYGGVLMRPSTATGSLITVNSNGNLITNMHLTCNGGTASSSQAIIMLKRNASTPSRCYNNVIRGCRFGEDKHSPGIGAVSGAIWAGTAQNLIVEDNLFDQCLGGVTMYAVSGDVVNNIIRRNIFAGNPASVDAHIVIGINSAGSYGNMIYSNIFGDGLPAYSSGGIKRFIMFQAPYQTAGSGILANNWFATATSGFAENGSEVQSSDTFFMPGNYYEGTNAGPYGQVVNS